jgi:hypothetical protein
MTLEQPQENYGRIVRKKPPGHSEEGASDRRCPNSRLIVASTSPKACRHGLFYDFRRKFRLSNRFRLLGTAARPEKLRISLRCKGRKMLSD